MSKIRASLKSKGGGSKGGGGSGSNLAARAGADLEKEKKEKKKKEKEKRVWAGENAKGKTDGLDFSEGKPSDKEGNAEVVERVDISAPSRVDAEEDEEYVEEEEEEEVEIPSGRRPPADARRAAGRRSRIRFSRLCSRTRWCAGWWAKPRWTGTTSCPCWRSSRPTS